MNDKAQLITALRQEFNRWEELLTGFSEEQITAPARIASMSIKDIVAHLTAWQQVSVAWMEAAQYDTEPEYPKWHPKFEPESNIERDQMNDWIYQTYREQPWSDIHREWRERFLNLLELGESIPEKNLLEAVRYPWLKEYPLSAVLLGSYEHHEEHMAPLLA